MNDSPHIPHPHLHPRPPRLTMVMGLTRWFSMVTVLSSLVGALLMFVIGAANTAEAVMRYAGIHPDPTASPHPSPRPAANLLLLESLDNGLTGLTFLYFAYGIYALFLAKVATEETAPRWLTVKTISDLKKTLLEVVAVLLAIMFVRTLAERLLTGDLTWQLMVIPASILAIAIAAKLMFSETGLKKVPATKSGQSAKESQFQPLAERD